MKKLNNSTSCVGECPAEGSSFLVKVHSPQQGPKCKKVRGGDLAVKGGATETEEKTV